MNYHCSPDLDPKKDLTVDAVRLFQRFRQTADKKAVDDLLQQELTRHLKLCELAILHAASAGMYWCDLPRHPIHDFDIGAGRHLEKMGFEVEFGQTAQEQTLPSRDEPEKPSRPWWCARRTPPNGFSPSLSNRKSPRQNGAAG